MSESQAAYDTDLKPFTREQIADINKYLSVIRDISGFGVINLIVENNNIRFVRLENLSRKYDDCKS